MFNRIKHLVIKEFLIILKDRRSRLLLILPPIIQLLIFSFAATHEVKNVSLGIYNEDSGCASRELISHFQAIPTTFSHIIFYRDIKSIKRAIDEQRILVAIHIGTSFSKDLTLGIPATVQILLDGRKANTSLIIEGYINRVIQKFVSKWFQYKKSNHYNREGFSIIIPRVWFNPNLKSTWSTVPALIGILSNLVVLLITALSVAREREMGTFEQLLISPLRPIEILIGKSLPPFILGITEGMVMGTIVSFVFNLPLTRSGLLLLFISIALFIMSIVGVGLFISSIAKTQQQGFLGAFAYQVPATLLCGFATPVKNMPHWLQMVAYINPLQYMVTLCRTIFLENPSAQTVIKIAWPLIPIGLFTLTVSTLLFKKKIG